MAPLYPAVTVPLQGQDGGAFSIIGRTRMALKSADVPQEEIERFTLEAQSGSYDDLLQTVMKWVDTE